MPSLSDSSLTSDTPSMVLELTRSAICSQSEALLVWYGMEVITTASRAWPFLPPPLTFSTVAAPLRFTPPLPVRYISLKPPRCCTMMPPVGKSGAGIASSRSSSVQFSGSEAYRTNAFATSLRLWGGMDVAMPTAIPVLPLMSRLGKRAGSTAGSVWDPSNVSVKSTASRPMSASSIASAAGLRRHSV